MDELLANPSARRAGLGALAAILLIALVALLDLGPCADKLSREEFIAQGDEICAQAHDEFRGLQTRSPRTPTEGVDLTETLIELAEEERDAVADLREPEEMSDQVERYLNARERGIEVLREGLAAAEAADAGTYEEAQAELAGNQLERFAIAREIGFEECSKPLVGRDELKRQAEPPASTDPDAPPQVDNPPT